MGRDISPIGNHDLDTSEISRLAIDLTSRFDINITFGFTGYKEHFELLGLDDRSRQFIILDKIIQNPKFETYTLEDDFYLNKKVIKKFGQEILNEKKYWSFFDDDDKVPDKNSEFRINESKCIEFPEYELYLNSKDKTEYLSINKENYSNGIPYFSRWWAFCRFFTEKSYKEREYLDFFLQFRTSLKYYSEKLGGTKIYYLDDQSNVLEGVGQGSEFDLTWNNFEKFVKEKTGNLLLNIPKFIADNEYQNEFLNLNEYPLAMIDDFSDL